MNSQTVRMFAEYGLAARALRDSRLRALILTGAGERAFCAGFDLDEIDVITRMGVREFLKFQETAAGGIQALRHLPFPVIAAVHGAAAGGGLALALAADIRLVSPTAKFSAAFLKVGLSMGELGHVVQPHPADRPRKGGRDRLHRRASWARRRPSRSGWPTGSFPPTALRRGRRAGAADRQRTRPAASGCPSARSSATRRSRRMPRRWSWRTAARRCSPGPQDMPEALAAFKEKRAPRFTGR